MGKLGTIAREVFGLVVDDGILAAAVVVWTAAVWFLVSRVGLPPGWGALALCAGLVAILIETTLRRARS